MSSNLRKLLSEDWMARKERLDMTRACVLATALRTHLPKARRIMSVQKKIRKRNNGKTSCSRDGRDSSNDTENLRYNRFSFTTAEAGFSSRFTAKL